MNNRIEEILLSCTSEHWEMIKNGTITIEIQRRKPERISFPFRVIVYIIGGIGVVGKFDCFQMRQTIRPAIFESGSNMTESELMRYVRKKAVCGWYIKPGSVVEYESPIPLEEATGLKLPPSSWRYLSRENT